MTDIQGDAEADLERMKAELRRARGRVSRARSKHAIERARHELARCEARAKAMGVDVPPGPKPQQNHQPRSSGTPDEWRALWAEEAIRTVRLAREAREAKATVTPVGTRRIDPSGYARVFTEALAWVPEHRYVMERMLDRELVRGENVHHINGDRADNRPENLELWWRPQPGGQRVSQLLDYVTAMHAAELRRRLARGSTS